ncbi:MULTISPECIES: YlxR family protein [Spirulina sp. CCY15215]|uniref:YlxR family protein n=1 Tax=Spirulina sp. CCY15215 TaxID=2767591 RepID=UPI001950793F|nr:YlxR family protein [Spirulina major]
MKPNLRRCISCRKIAPKNAFWRIVRQTGGDVNSKQTVQLDKGMGRSAYLCPQRDCLEAAQKKNRLARSLKANAPQEVYQNIYQTLRSRLAAIDKRNSHPP